ncbi:WecB/TagA/CpsF family glycosyltransferase [Shewanella marisflavi]|uniref:WecB/TagA/CpsF family glycosyltransferase n=1 Tax=Shewanella marisflavi TaxID=260364 RepID=UPI00200C0C27|nr:WecB/TagA/CpsF family glycosyltransferase [Shewanella marisflavi]MCL1040924.1 WecB/TagA/CpsF family glycosyltransferase [Shewanella marisflavi]
MYKVNIAGLPIDCFKSMEQIVNYIFEDGKGKTAVAINPEKILASLEDINVRNAILDSDIRYLDGIGAVKLAESKSNMKLVRIPGCELWERLMEVAGSRQASVFLLGSSLDVVVETKKKLESQYNVNVVGFNDGYFKDDTLIIKKLLLLQPDIITVAMGSPRQELFMKLCRDAGVNSFMMGVGGTYNVFVGSVRRAPKVFCDLHLEWFYRLISEPSRIFRQLRLLKFVKLAILRKL